MSDDARVLAAALAAVKLHIGALQVELFLVQAERDNAVRACETFHEQNDVLRALLCGAEARAAVTSGQEATTPERSTRPGAEPL
jgi:hypothetical protein